MMFLSGQFCLGRFLLLLLLLLFLVLLLLALVLLLLALLLVLLLLLLFFVIDGIWNVVENVLLTSGSFKKLSILPGILPGGWNWPWIDPIKSKKREIFNIHGWKEKIYKSFVCFTNWEGRKGRFTSQCFKYYLFYFW